MQEARKRMQYVQQRQQASRGELERYPEDQACVPLPCRWQSAQLSGGLPVEMGYYCVGVREEVLGSVL